MATQKPDLQDAAIMDFLAAVYGLQVVEMTFLPIGYEFTAVYRVVAADDAPYFLKLKRDIFEETSVNVPIFLYEHGIRQIIPPMAARSGQFWSRFNDYHVILYPFIEGHNGFKSRLNEHQWAELGAAFKSIHSMVLPVELSRQLPRESYSQQARETVKGLLERIKIESFHDPIAAQFAAFIRAKTDAMAHLVWRADQLASVLQAQPPEFVLCHSDIHAGNVLIDAQGRLFIVDWDNPILAPKERDLMFIGGGIGGIWNTAQEEALFHKGYGQTEVNPVALAYYRFERILQDFAGFDPQLSDTHRTDRARTLGGAPQFFASGGVVEMAYKAGKLLPPELR